MSKHRFQPYTIPAGQYGGWATGGCICGWDMKRPPLNNEDWHESCDRHYSNHLSIVTHEELFNISESLQRIADALEALNGES